MGNIGSNGTSYLSVFITIGDNTSEHRSSVVSMNISVNHN